MQMVQVIIPRTTKYHHIIQISFAIILKTFENFIYEPTERCWRVTETKSHVTPLPVSLRGHKPSQVNMFRGNRYLKIGLCHVQLHKKPSPPNRIKNKNNARNGKRVGHCNRIKPSKIDAQPTSAIWFWYYKDGRSPSTCAFLNDTFGQQRFNLQVNRP